MKRAGEYGNMTSVSNKEKNAVYIAENLMLYSGVSEDDDILKQIESYLYGEKGAINIDFNTEENKRDGNTIYIDKKLISGLISTHNGVIGDINQMAVLTAKIGHELYHDGINEVDEEVTKQVQGILSANPSLSKTQLRELLLSQGMDEEDVDKAISNVFEDISCHAFEASIWGGLKDTFGVSNFEEDAKYLAYYSGDKDFFTRYVSSFYMLGQEKDAGNPNKSIKEQYEALIQKYKSEAKDGILINLEDERAIQLLSDARNSYINELHIENYTATNFNYDLQSWFGLNLIQGNNTQLSLERDYNLLISSQMTSQFSDAEWTSFGCATDQEKMDYLKRLYGNAFNNIFNLMLNNDSVRTNFSIIKDSIASHIDVKDIFSFSFEQGTSNISSSSTNIETVNGYSNSIMWMFEMYQRYTGDSNTAYDFGANGFTGQGINNTFFQYYLVQDSTQLQELGNLLNERTINVKDSNTTDGYSRTHFIANIDFLINLFTDLRDGVQAIDGISDWESFDWREGYRPIADSGSIENGHTCNCAIDLLNIQVQNSNNQTVYLSAEQQFELLMHFIDSGNYEGWKEWKKGIQYTDTETQETYYVGGYHLGTMGGNSVAFGNTTTDSRSAAEALLASLGIPVQNYANYWNEINDWYCVNYAAIEAFLNGNNNTTTNTGN